MAKRSYRPEVYELVTDFILEHPNEVITRKMIQEGTGSTFEESEQLMDIMAGIHNATIRRQLASSPRASRSPTSRSTASVRPAESSTALAPAST